MCELIWIGFGQSFKDFSISSSGHHFVQLSTTLCATLIEGIIWNNCVKLF